jgi:hypothetical protein
VFVLVCSLPEGTSSGNWRLPRACTGVNILRADLFRVLIRAGAGGATARGPGPWLALPVRPLHARA